MDFNELRLVIYLSLRLERWGYGGGDLRKVGAAGHICRKVCLLSLRINGPYISFVDRKGFTRCMIL